MQIVWLEEQWEEGLDLIYMNIEWASGPICYDSKSLGSIEKQVIFSSFLSYVWR